MPAPATDTQRPLRAGSHGATGASSQGGEPVDGWPKCDRCPAEAKVRYTKADEQPWQWCAHCARRYDAGLTSQGWQRFALVRVPAGV